MSKVALWTAGPLALLFLFAAAIHADENNGLVETAAFTAELNAKANVMPISYTFSDCDPCGCDSAGCNSCNSGCSTASSCGCGEYSCQGCCDRRLLGLIAPSDHCFDCFISPMTNPVFFEDPRTLTEARLIFLNHKLPGALGGANVRLIAMQLRAAVTDRLSIIATKDGYIMSTAAPIVDGWADLSAGLKYNLFANPETQRLLSVGATFEFPVGSQRALQGNGDGMFHAFLTGGTAIGAWHWISGAGVLLPTDTNAESQFCYWSNHFDRRIGCTNLYALTEFNWYHYLGSGGGGIPGIEGGDLFNLGSTGVAGNNIVTGAVGVKWKPTNHTEVGVAWEIPLTGRRDVLDNRLTIDWIIRY